MNNTWKSITPAAKQFTEYATRNPKRTLLVFDFDGTLAHIVPNPEDASMVEASAAAMTTLSEAGVDIAVISGRPVETLRRLAKVDERPALSRATIYGQYGAERLHVATGELTSPQPPASIAAAKAMLQTVADRHPGSHVEDKGLAVALHVRNATNPDETFTLVEDDITNIATENELTVEPGRYVWELRAASITKGDALAALIQERKPGAVAFAGDDLGDIAALDVLDNLSGIAKCAVISASPEAPQLAERADILADGPDGVANWLNDLAKHVSAG